MCVCLAEKRGSLTPFLGIIRSCHHIVINHVCLPADGDGHGCLSGGESCDLAHGWLTPYQVPVGENCRNVRGWYFFNSRKTFKLPLYRIEKCAYDCTRTRELLFPRPRFGRWKVLLAGLLTLAVSTALYGVAPSVAFLFLASGLHGGALSLVHVSSLGLLSAFPERITESMAGIEVSHSATYDSNLFRIRPSSHRYADVPLMYVM